MDKISILLGALLISTDNDIFGGKESYETALEELEQQLYKQG